MVIMLQKFVSNKWIVAAVIGTMLFALLTVFVWRILLLAQTEPDVAARSSVLRIGYCGAELTELCILSFGRDADGNTVVNLFVPERDFPDFYLIASRVTGEYLFECSRSRNVPTSVYCVGSALNLGERVEFSVFAQEDDRLLAKGGLILKAFLISAPGMEAGAGTETVTETATATDPASGDGTVAPPSTGYPNDP
jgi:hypothetical protein